jgi:ribosomal protein S18 acetylase RimI-like enzyme
MEMQIRSATKDDALWIKQIYKQESKNLGSFNLFQVWEKYLTGGAPNKFIAIGNYAFCNYNYSVRKKCFVIHDIGILNEYKGKGIGKFIVLKIAEIARRRGTYLMLKCNCDNVEGNAFYQKIGMKNNGICLTKKGAEQNLWII